MSRSTLPVLLSCWVLCLPAQAQPEPPSNDDIRRELADLAGRVQRLEAENELLKQRNARLEQVMGVQGPSAASPQPADVIGPATAQRAWDERVEVSGYVFGDAYAVLDHHDPAIDGLNGFWIRRAYLTVDADLADEWTSRLRLEFNSPGDFESSDKMSGYVKDAYLAWRRDGQELYLGLSPAPTFDLVESHWGFRHVEKTPLDLYRMGSSREFGIACKGRALERRLLYHAAFGNGAGESAETNEGKKAMLALGFRPDEAWVGQVYADHEDRPGPADRTTWQAFLGWTGERSRLGLLYASQERGQAGGATDETLAVASVYGAWALGARGTLLARYDRSFDGYPDADRIPYLAIAPDLRFDFALLGWEYALRPDISLTPNVEYVRYRDTSGRAAPGDDLYGRLTLHYEF